MTTHNKIDEIFKEGLSNYSEKPPAFIWDNVEKELKHGRNVKRRTLYYGIAASVALILSFGAGYLFTGDSATNIAENNQTTNIENKVPQQDENNTTIVAVTNEEPKQLAKNQKTANKKASKENTNNINKINNPTRTVIPVKEETKIKKVKSSGSLLPPMYSSQSDFNENQKNLNSINSTKEIEKINNTQKIEKLAVLIEVNKSEKNLIYEIRQAPLPPVNEVETPKKVENNWGVGISGTPLLSYRNVQSVSNETMYSSVNQSGLQQNYKNEKPIMSYAAGVNVNYNISNRWNIQSGIYYSETGQVIDDINLTESPWSLYSNGGTGEYTINTSTGNMVINESTDVLRSQIDKSDNTELLPLITINQNGEIVDGADRSISTSEFIQKFEYYEVPLIVSYKIINKKLNVKLSGGLSANFLAANHNYIENTKNEIDAEITGLRKTSYSSIIGCGFDYPIISKISLSLNPTFRYSLNSINNKGKTYPYSFGVFTGLTYSF